MNVEDILAQLADRGIRVELAPEDHIDLVGHLDELDAFEVERIKAHKSEIRRYLEQARVARPVLQEAPCWTSSDTSALGYPPLLGLHEAPLPSAPAWSERAWKLAASWPDTDRREIATAFGEIETRAWPGAPVPIRPGESVHALPRFLDALRRDIGFGPVHPRAHRVLPDLRALLAHAETWPIRQSQASATKAGAPGAGGG